MFSTDFSSNIFNLQLAESEDVEPTDTEGHLHSKEEPH